LEKEVMMKFTPWQRVAVLAILLAAIIVANMYVPGAVATLVSMATTVFAALFVRCQDDQDPPPGSPPALRLLAGGGRLALGIVACGHALEALNDASDDATLGRCRAEARSAARDGRTPEEAWDHYLSCTRDAGLR